MRSHGNSSVAAFAGMTYDVGVGLPDTARGRRGLECRSEGEDEREAARGRGARTYGWRHLATTAAPASAMHSTPT